MEFSYWFVGQQKSSNTTTADMPKIVPKVHKPFVRTPLVCCRIRSNALFSSSTIQHQHTWYNANFQVSSVLTLTPNTYFLNRYFHLFGNHQKQQQPLPEVDFVNAQNVKVGIKGTENPNNYLVFVQIDGHSIAEDLVALQKMFPGKNIPQHTPQKAIESSDTQEAPAVHEGKTHTLWIPFYGTIHYQTLDIQNQTFHRLGFEFDKHKTKGADKLFDPNVDGNTKAAAAIRLLVDVVSKVPFAGSISERITKTVLSKVNLKI